MQSKLLGPGDRNCVDLVNGQIEVRSDWRDVSFVWVPNNHGALLLEAIIAYYGEPPVRSWLALHMGWPGPAGRQSLRLWTSMTYAAELVSLQGPRQNKPAMGMLQKSPFDLRSARRQRENRSLPF